MIDKQKIIMAIKSLEKRDYYKKAKKAGNKIAKYSDKMLLSNNNKVISNYYLEECLNRAYSATDGGLRPEDGVDIVAFDLSKRIEVLVNYIKNNLII